MPERTKPKKYRLNVAIVVVNARGQILACERSDVAGAWQIPQGGVEKNEELEAAARRELYEEIGVKQIEVIGQLPEPIRYEWPPELYRRGYCGQEQHYFLVRLLNESEIKLDGGDCPAEFTRTEWVSVDQFVKRLSGFKSKAYRSAISQIQAVFPGVLA